MMLVLVWVAFSDQAWSVPNTGVFSRVLPTQAAAGSDGDFFLADIHEHRILHFDGRGNRLPDIGRKGQGPGEFSFRLMALDFHDGHLYAVELMGRTINVYDAGGHYLRTLTTPFLWNNPLQPPFKLGVGWLVFHEAKLLHLDDSFQTLLSLAEEEVGDREPRQGSPRGYNPARDLPRFTLDRERGQVYFYVPGKGFAVQSYDPTTGSITLLLSVDAPRHPFDKRWGMEKLEARRKTATVLRQFEWVADFPEYFPEVIDLHLDFEDHLHVTRGIALVKPELPVWVFDLAGNPVDDFVPTAELMNILASDERWLYVARYRDEELGIYKLERADYRRSLTRP